MSETADKRSLRPRKSINYLEVIQNKPTPSKNGKPDIPSPFKNEVKVIVKRYDTSTADAHSSSPPTSDYDFDPKEEDITAENESSSSNSDSEFFAKKRKSSIVPKTQLLQQLAKTDDTMDEENEYRLQRQKNMAERLNVLRTMDFEHDLNEVASCVFVDSTPVERASSQKKTPSVKRPKPEKTPGSSVPVRKQPSRRSKNTPQRFESDRERRSDRLFGSFENHVVSNDNTEEDEKYPDENILEENLDIVKPDDDSKFLKQLQKELYVTYDSVSDFTTCDFDKFRKLMKSFTMVGDPVKVINSRIVTLAFHSSESKLLLLIGDKNGNVCLWDVSENKGVTLKAHQSNVNCVTFSSQDTNKFYTTSLDGTTRKGDINSNSLQLLYSSSNDRFVSRELHTTWHHELGHTLLIAKGDGVVKLLDMRAPSRSDPSYRCHSRSVRTVESHPCNENYFLTSSGTSVFGIWDLRNIKSSDPKAVILEEFPKALSGAFYSHTGSYVLTTSNDDTIRIYDCRNDESNLLLKIPHNNHGGRWVSQFKARWQPKREDCFYAGSLLTKPKRIQAYDFNGHIISDLRSKADRYLPVVMAHPSKPIVAGGDASGYINIFSPIKDLSEVC